MTTGFITEFIAGRMRKLGYAAWDVEFRSLAAVPSGTLEIPAHGSYLYFPSDYLARNLMLRVESDAGTLEAGTALGSSQTWEHTGTVRVVAATNYRQFIHFIEATPTQKA